MVSVIIPCYNCEKTIETTLTSLERQSYKDFEVIAVNDGSVDRTKEILEQYVVEGKLKMQILHLKNSGVSAARNYGINNCRGKYITFLDADDAYENVYLERLVAAMETSECDAAMCQYRFVDETNLKDEVLEIAEAICLSKYQVLELFKHKRKTKINFYNIIYRKEIIEKYNIRFPQNIRYGEDSVFLCTYLFYCDRGIKNYLIPLYQYRRNPASAMYKVCYERAQTIEAFKMIVDLWRQDAQFDEKDGIYMIDRAIWAVAKDFAIASKELFVKFCKEYDVKNAMKNMAFGADELQIRVTAWGYLISPSLFQSIIKGYKNLQKNVR